MARRLTTNQEILGSIPSVFIFVFCCTSWYLARPRFGTSSRDQSWHLLLPSATGLLLFVIQPLTFYGFSRLHPHDGALY
jgi:hypothetical protein